MITFRPRFRRVKFYCGKFKRSVSVTLNHQIALKILLLSQRLQFGWIDQAPDDLDGQPLFQQQKDGWEWIAPFGNGRSAWTKLRRKSARGGIDYTWRLYCEFAGRGYFLLGDAASLMDPSAANGVLRALMSGIYAVHLIANRDSESSKEITSEYKSWTENLFDFSLISTQEHS